MFEIFLLAEKASLRHVHVSDALVTRVCSANGVVTAASPVCQQALLVDFRGNSLQEGHLCANPLEVIHRKFDLGSGFGPSDLHGSASGKDCDEISAECAECDHQPALKPRSICEEEHNGGDAPCHAEHGEQTTSTVVLECLPSLASDVVNHEGFPRYSCRKASTGTMCAALRAG